MPTSLPDVLRSAPLRRGSCRAAALGIAALCPLSCFGQQDVAKWPDTPSKHVLWIIPNFATSSELEHYAQLTSRQKFQVAAQDTFDRGTIALAATFAADSQISRSEPAFGGGPASYAHYWITAYSDLAIGNYMTEAIFPTFLHQDPRYFRKGSGSLWSRVGSAVGQIFWTYTDSGGRQFNYSEVAGNASAVAVSTAYYPAGRNASSAVEQLGTQIAVDVAANIIKEFWPSREREAARKSGAGER